LTPFDGAAHIDDLPRMLMLMLMMMPLFAIWRYERHYGALAPL